MDKLKQGISQVIENTRHFSQPSYIQKQMRNDFGDNGVYSKIMNQVYDLKPISFDDINFEDEKTLKERRTKLWGNNPNEYKLNEYLINDTNNPIRLEEINGRFRVLDGNHRLYALRNAGFTSGDFLIKRK